MPDLKKVYEIDYEVKLFESQKKFIDTFKKDYLVEIYFLLKDYLVILCKFKGISDEELVSFIKENLSSELVDRMLESSFTIETSWKSFLIKRMNNYIEDFVPTNIWHKPGGGTSTGQFDISPSRLDIFFMNCIDERDYTFLNIDLDKNLAIIRFVKKVIYDISEAIEEYFSLNPYVFEYYFYIMILNNGSILGKFVPTRMFSILTYSFNLYNFKLKSFLLDGPGKYQQIVYDYQKEKDAEGK